MTDAPKRIWTAGTDGKCHVGFDTPSMNYTNEYLRADLAAAQVADAVAAERERCAKLAVAEYNRRIRKQLDAGRLDGIAMMHGQVAEAMRVLAAAIRAGKGEG